MLTASSNQAEPTLAEGGDGGGMLLLWTDDRNNDEAIYHALFTPEHLQTTIIHYTYDPLYRLTEAQYSGILSGTYSYGYDEVGNRLIFSSNITETRYLTNTLRQAQCRPYNSANQLVTAKLNSSATTWYYQFDANGNQIRQVPDGLTAAAGEVRYTFNQRNLLVQTETHDVIR